LNVVTFLPLIDSNKGVDKKNVNVNLNPKKKCSTKQFVVRENKENNCYNLESPQNTPIIKLNPTNIGTPVLNNDVTTNKTSTKDLLNLRYLTEGKKQGCGIFSCFGC